MAEIDHEFTKEIVCPYCGYVHSESYEFGNGADDGDDECGKCGKKFSWSRMISVSYSTSKTGEEGDDEDCEDEGREDDGDNCWCHDPDMGARG
jgi:transcription elongation factor Elf1